MNLNNFGSCVLYPSVIIKPTNHQKGSKRMIRYHTESVNKGIFFDGWCYNYNKTITLHEEAQVKYIKHTETKNKGWQNDE